MRKIYYNLNMTMMCIKTCIHLSFQSSWRLTIARMVLAQLIPVIAITATKITAMIISLLSDCQNSSEAWKQILFLVGLLMGIRIANIGLTRVLDCIQTIQNEKVGLLISEQVTEKALSVDVDCYDDPSYYNNLSLVSRDSAAIINCIWHIVNMGTALISCLIIAVSFGAEHLDFVICILIGVIPACITGIKYTKKYYKMQDNLSENERFRSYLGGIAIEKGYSQSIRMFQAEHMILDRFRKQSSIIQTKKKNISIQRSKSMAIAELLPEISIAYVWCKSGYSVFRGFEGMGEFSLYTSLAIQLWSEISSLIDSVTLLYDDRLCVEHYADVISRKNKIKDGNLELSTPIKKIEFVNVSFRYTSDSPMILKGISFIISDCEKLGIVGENGDGKSTIIKLLLRFYDPTEGEIYINDINIKEYTIYSVRRQISCYLQNAPLYRLSIKDIFCIADGEKTTNDIEAAMQRAAAYDTLEHMNGNIDTFISKTFDKNGLELSGGQAQKLNIAMSFYKGASVLVMDEPSSNLDPISEQKIFRELMGLEQRIMIVISHRLQFLRSCTKIIVIAGGTIKEQGTFEELIIKNGIFSKYYHAQNELLNDD